MSLFNLSAVKLKDLPEAQDAYIFGIFSDTGISAKFKSAHPNLCKQITLAMDSGEFEAKLNQTPGSLYARL